MRTSWAGKELLARESRVRAPGSRHSPNAIADTDGVQVSLDRVLRG